MLTVFASATRNTVVTRIQLGIWRLITRASPCPVTSAMRAQDS